MAYFDPGNGKFVVIDGNIVERDALRIAEKIREYDSDLELICLDPDSDHALSSAPFIVIKDRGNGVFDRVLEAWTLDDQIIERLYLADGQATDLLDRLAKMEYAKKKEQEDKWQETKWQSHELFAAAMQNPKSSFTFHNNDGELVRVHDTDGIIKDNNKKSFMIEVPYASV